ncbi:uncharacterized protein LOC108436052 isoform X2 [Pygocentrus nattereri]|uniref:uncharacterized protein LOC108436052 isoform X2 n=1 Tax=Pygocentrus nattereri TaxID=42514 RepID=UPI0008144227|nr:uncharacterized protein LOC108436052 isoform X2 [Pygocentrus nattereri]
MRDCLKSANLLHFNTHVTHGRPTDTTPIPVDARAETAASRPRRQKRHCPAPVSLGDVNHHKDTMVWLSSATATGEAQEKTEESKGQACMQQTHGETSMLTENFKGGTRTVRKQQEEAEALKKPKQQECLTPDRSLLNCGRLTPEAVHYSTVPKYFEYCTGFSYDQYNHLCAFFGLPRSAHAPQSEVPLTFLRSTKSVKSMPLRVQFLLVLMKLRNNFDVKDLAFRFQIDPPSVSIIFRSWIPYLYNKLGQIPTWPHRDIIASQMPTDYKNEYPTTFAILDCTEIKSYSEHKSAGKCLIACDPRGSVMFVSNLFGGSVSDRDVFNQCGITAQLKNLIMCGYLHKGDALMAQKGFLLDTDVKKLGLKLDVSPTAKSRTQTCSMGTQTTKTAAKHRVLVDRAIGKIKKFKIVSNRVSHTGLKNINEIWFVVSMLSNFQPHIA